jgi:hypothetical protein
MIAVGRLILFSLYLTRSASFLGATSQYAVVNASTNKSFFIFFILINVQPYLPHLLSTGKMIVLSKDEKTFWSFSDNLIQVLFFMSSYVAKIFLFTLKEVFSK